MTEKQNPLEEWQQYPVYTELLTDHAKFTALREKCLKSCEELDRIIREGSTDARSAAQKSLNAFGFALSLLDEAIQKRDEILEAQN